MNDDLHPSSSHELSHQFEDLHQQKNASELGMWTFLVTEVLFFGAVFAAYGIYRWQYGDVFTIASLKMNLVLGSLNTAVLLTSSLTMALAVHSAEEGHNKRTIQFLLLTMVLGCIFLGIKGVEYYQKFQEHLIPGAHFVWDGPHPDHAQIFYFLYFVMTGLHALHMIIGVGVLSCLVLMTWAGRFTKTYCNPVHIAGLYWHFVDIVWIFLFPVLYLIGRR